MTPAPMAGPRAARGGTQMGLDGVRRVAAFRFASLVPPAEALVAMASSEKVLAKARLASLHKDGVVA